MICCINDVLEFGLRYGYGFVLVHCLDGFLVVALLSFSPMVGLFILESIYWRHYCFIRANLANFCFIRLFCQLEYLRKISSYVCWILYSKIESVYQNRRI